MLVTPTSHSIEIGTPQDPRLKLSGSGSGGSGGAIRIIASEVLGGSRLDASGGTAANSSNGVNGGNGAQGVIRIETFNLNRAFNFVDGRAFQSLPGLIDTSGTDLPTLRISKIGGADVPLAPSSNTAMPALTIPSGVANPVPIEVTATNVTPGQTAMIRINYEGNGGEIIEATTAALAGTNALSTAVANVNLAGGVGTMAAIMQTPPFVPAPIVSAPSFMDNMQLTIDGETVTKIETVSVAGADGTEIVYLTDTGKSARFNRP